MYLPPGFAAELTAALNEEAAKVGLLRSDIMEKKGRSDLSFGHVTDRSHRPPIFLWNLARRGDFLPRHLGLAPPASGEDFSRTVTRGHQWVMPTLRLW